MSATHDPQDVATKVTRILQRPDGSEVKIVAQTVYGRGLHPSVATQVFRRDNAAQRWHPCDASPASGWREMPREQYLKEGRSEVLQTVTPGEILATCALLGKPMSSFANVA